MPTKHATPVPDNTERTICNVRFYINATGELNARVAGIEVEDCAMHGVTPDFREQVRLLVEEADWFERAEDPKPVRRRPAKPKARRP